MPRISEAERAIRRERLVDAAWRCLAHQAYSDLTVDDVCAEASVSKGGFYGYFESKQELLRELLQRESASLDSVIADLSAEPIGAASDCGVSRERVSGTPRTARACSCAPTSPQPSAATLRSRPPSANPRAAAASHSEGGSRRACAPATCGRYPANALASIVLALVDGLALHHRSDPTAFTWRNVRVALDAVISGIEAD